LKGVLLNNVLNPYSIIEGMAGVMQEDAGSKGQNWSEYNESIVKARRDVSNI
jgi:hypothetical protein